MVESSKENEISIIIEVITKTEVKVSGSNWSDAWPQSWSLGIVGSKERGTYVKSTFKLFKVSVSRCVKVSYLSNP